MANPGPSTRLVVRRLNPTSPSPVPYSPTPALAITLTLTLTLTLTQARPPRTQREEELIAEFDKKWEERDKAYNKAWDERDACDTHYHRIEKEKWHEREKQLKDNWDAREDEWQAGGGTSGRREWQWDWQ